MQSSISLLENHKIKLFVTCLVIPKEIISDNSYIPNKKKDINQIEKVQDGHF